MQVVALLAPIGSGLAMGVLQAHPAPMRRLPWLSLATGLLVATMLGLQLRIPTLLDHLARAPALLTEGQAWRAFTALFVQDGGLAGGIFNLVLLLAVGPIAESRLGPWHWAIIYFGGGIVTELAALAWQPNGAGNSVACFALAGALIVTGLMRKPGWLSLVAALAGLAGAFVLLTNHDIHGIGFLVGTAIAAGLVRLGRPNATAGG